MFAVSCKGGGEKAKEEFKVPDDWKTYEAAAYTISFPEMEISWSDETLLNASNDDLFVSSNFYEGGPTIDQIKQTGENLVAMIKAMGKVPGTPVVEDNVVTVTAEDKDAGKTAIHYTIIGEGTKGVSGSVTYKTGDKANAETAANIIKTIKFK